MDSSRLKFSAKEFGKAGAISVTVEWTCVELDGGEDGDWNVRITRRLEKYPC